MPAENACHLDESEIKLRSLCGTDPAELLGELFICSQLCLPCVAVMEAVSVY